MEQGSWDVVVVVGAEPHWEAGAWPVRCGEAEAEADGGDGTGWSGTN